MKVIGRLSIVLIAIFWCSASFHSVLGSAGQFAINGNDVIMIDTVVKNKIVDSSLVEVGDSLFAMVEQMPEFPGGTEQLRRFIGTNLRYPIEAIKKKQQGRVYVGFIVDAKGKVTNAKIVRSSSYHLLDKEALRVVNAMPAWKPGIQKGVPVRVNYTLPISFKVP